MTTLEVRPNKRSSWSYDIYDGDQFLTKLKTFEDGRVNFITVPSLDSMPDHPWLNHHGDVEAGVNVDDASLAPSWRPPFVHVRQR